MKKAGLACTISHNRVDYLPDYGPDREANCRPLKAMAKVVEGFAGCQDGRAMRYWFRYKNSLLVGKRPQDLQATVLEQVVLAAQKVDHEVAHG